MVSLPALNISQLADVFPRSGRDAEVSENGSSRRFLMTNTATTGNAPRRPVSRSSPAAARLVGGPTALIELGGLRLLTDPTFDPPGDHPVGNRVLVKTSGPAATSRAPPAGRRPGHADHEQRREQARRHRQGPGALAARAAAAPSRRRPAPGRRGSWTPGSSSRPTQKAGSTSPRARNHHPGLRAPRRHRAAAPAGAGREHGALGAPGHAPRSVRYTRDPSCVTSWLTHVGQDSR